MHSNDNDKENAFEEYKDPCSDNDKPKTDISKGNELSTSSTKILDLADTLDSSLNHHLKPPSYFKSSRRRSKTYSGEELSSHLERINQLNSTEPKSQENLKDLPVINNYFEPNKKNVPANFSNNRRF